MYTSSCRHDNASHLSFTASAYTRTHIRKRAMNTHITQTSQNTQHFVSYARWIMSSFVILMMLCEHTHVIVLPECNTRPKMQCRIALLPRHTQTHPSSDTPAMIYCTILSLPQLLIDHKVYPAAASVACFRRHHVL